MKITFEVDKDSYTICLDAYGKKYGRKMGRTRYGAKRQSMELAPLKEFIDENDDDELYDAIETVDLNLYELMKILDDYYDEG